MLLVLVSLSLIASWSKKQIDLEGSSFWTLMPSLISSLAVPWTYIYLAAPSQYPIPAFIRGFESFCAADGSQIEPQIRILRKLPTFLCDFGNTRLPLPIPGDTPLIQSSIITNPLKTFFLLISEYHTPNWHGVPVELLLPSNVSISGNVFPYV